MTFATLTLVTLLGLLGPLIALRRTWHLPVVLGELAAGAVFGATGFGVLQADDHIFTFLADIGFALVMFTAGTHVPVRDSAVRSAVGRGLVRAAAVGVIAAILGVALSHLFGTGHAALYAVLLASSSAALVLPVIEGLGLSGVRVLELTAQVAIADTACIVALPLVVDPSNAVRAAIGSVAVGIAALAMFFALRWLENSGVRERVHHVSENRKFAVELRISLVVLFAMAALATTTHVSIMLAGFAFGLAVAGVGEPRRVAHQLFAVSDGFFAPLFFVWLGARIDLRELGTHPNQILLGLALAAGAILAHAAMRLLGQPVTLGILAASQLGVPVAAVTVGSALHIFAPGEAAALILGAVLTILSTAIAGAVAARTTAPATKAV
ncbi:cation:proton antiporter [Smaragdicoccus niigatensis]|uniref:cation:proton antiporter n=1 Tax=Smaragdicoccus niigatensis TaxID=359359 RepID=UPI000363FEF4|nr:cation:proton antiporter [Smaragdicoccus niigatensis]